MTFLCGKAWISSFTKRVAPGASIDIPLAHKDALYVRSHYDTIQAMMPDAPLEDEIVVVLVGASRGRLHARIGGLECQRRSLQGPIPASFIDNDFTIVNVANNSNSRLPAAYRLAATWGSHEGSMLLWALMIV